MRNTCPNKILNPSRQIFEYSDITKTSSSNFGPLSLDEAGSGRRNRSPRKRHVTAAGRVAWMSRLIAPLLSDSAETESTRSLYPDHPLLLRTGGAVRWMARFCLCGRQLSGVSPWSLPGQKMRQARPIVSWCEASWRGASWPSRHGLDLRAGPALPGGIVPIVIRAPVLRDRPRGGHDVACRRWRGAAPVNCWQLQA